MFAHMAKLIVLMIVSFENTLVAHRTRTSACRPRDLSPFKTRLLSAVILACFMIYSVSAAETTTTLLRGPRDGHDLPLVDDVSENHHDDTNSNTNKTKQKQHACQWTVIDIPRIHVNDIGSVEDFWDTYSEAPIIITGIVDDSWRLESAATGSISSTDSVGSNIRRMLHHDTYQNNHNNNNNHAGIWEFDALAQQCAHADMPVMKKVNDPQMWANLELAGTRKLDRFIEYVLQNDDHHKDNNTIETASSSSSSQQLYGFDFEIAQQCPRLLSHFKIPRFFNECLLQTSTVKEHFQEYYENSGMFNWPTMMVGGKGTTSALHVDNNGLPFWMTLLQGRKHWRSLPYKDNYHTTGPYPTFEYIPPPYGDDGKNYAFRGQVLEEYNGGGTFTFDGFHPDFTKYPELCHAVMHEGILEAGEVLYMPNSAPHGVVNLEHTIALTANFFHPLDKSQGLWLDRNCNAKNAEQERGFSPAVCHYMYNRIWHRKEHMGPQDDLDYSSYMNEHYFQQMFDEEL